MTLSRSIVALAPIFLSLLFSVAAQNTTSSAQDATAFALVYGYPLLAFTKLAGILVPAFHANTFFHSRQLAGPSQSAVIRPNADTLYSAAIYDLSKNDVSLELPAVPSEQFVLYSFYDPYGDNFANIATKDLTTPTRYFLRQRGTDQFGIVSANATALGSNYSAAINSPSFYGVLLARMLVNATTIDAVHGYQDASILTNVTRASGGTSVPAINTLTLQPSNTSSPAQNVLNLLAQYAAYDEPETNAAIPQVQQQLQETGVSNGTWTLPPNANLTSANTTAQQTIAAAASSPNNTINLNNGWSIISPAVQGNNANGTNFALRSAVAAGLYLGLSAPIAIYPSWSNMTTSNNSSAFTSPDIPLSTHESLLYTFSACPAILSPGFWSLTAYSGGFLIPNPLQVYQVGDRSNLTYSNGTRVYGPGGAAVANVSTVVGVGGGGTFQILVQAADVPPPANWTANWLPGPAGGGNLSVALRWYGAAQALLDGSYVYPKVTRQAAVVANGTTTGGSGGNGTATASGGAVPSTTETSGGGKNEVLYVTSLLVMLTMILCI